LSKKLVIGRTYSEQIIGNTCSFKAFKEHRCIGNDSIIHKFYTFDEKTD
jgi:serine/threonine protein kinase